MVKLMGTVILANSGGRVQADNVATNAWQHNGKVTMISNLQNPSAYRPAKAGSDPLATLQYGYTNGAPTLDSVLRGTTIYDTETAHPYIGQIQGGANTAGLLASTGFWNQGSVSFPGVYRVELFRLAGASSPFAGYDQIFIKNNSASTVSEVMLKVDNNPLTPIVHALGTGTLPAGRIFSTTVKNGAVVSIDVPITFDPVADQIAYGGTATFSVNNADGGGVITYQWQVNTGAPWSNLPGETNATLTLTGVTPSMHGWQYRCLLTDNTHSQFTNAAKLIVPITVSCPSNANYYAGNTITLSVSATGGNGVYTYQWYKDGNPLSDGGRISGATTATLTISNAQTGTDNGGYYCVVGDTDGTPQTTSCTATIAVYDLISASISPSVYYVNIGDNLTLAPTLSGGIPPITYQWQVDNGSGWQDIFGATASTLNITNVLAPMHGYKYRIAVTDATYTEYSNAATLGVLIDATITSAGGNAYVGEGITFTVSAVGGNGVYTYQWSKDGVPLSDGGNISGSQSDTLTISTLTLADSGAYRCTVSDTDGTPADTTDPVTLTVYDLLTVSIAPVLVTALPGSNVSFVATVSGGIPPLTYAWERDDGSGFAPLTDGPFVSGSNTTTLSLVADPQFDGNNFRIQVTDGGSIVSGVSTVASNTALIWVGNPLAVVANPTSLQVYVDAPFFTLQAQKADGYGPVSYTWIHRDPVTLMETTVDTGVMTSDTTQLVVVPSVPGLGFHQYYCRFSDAQATVDTALATVEVGNHVSITVDTAGATPNGSGGYDFTAVRKESMTLTMQVTGGLGPINHQWYKDDGSKVLQPLSDGNGVSGSNTLSLSINPVAYEDAGNYVYAASDNFETTYSPTITVFVAHGVPVANAVGLIALTLFLACVAALYAVQWGRTSTQR
jgi:hypothetical protein